MSRKTHLIGYESRGGRATVHSPTNIDIFPKHTNFSFLCPSNVDSIPEAISLLRKLSIDQIDDETRLQDLFETEEGGTDGKK